MVTTEPRESDGYEFTPAQDEVISATASRTRVWGALVFAGGCGVAALGVFAFLSAETFGAVAGVVYGVLTLIPIFIGLNFMDAGKDLGAVVATAGHDIDHLMDAMRNLGAAFQIQIVAAVTWLAVLVLGVVAAVAVPRMTDTTGIELAAAQKADLRTLAALQELFYAIDHDGDGVNEYATEFDLALTRFEPSEGVTVRITAADEDGWAATSTHAARAREGCAIVVGDAPRPITPGGEMVAEDGVPTCDVEG